MQGMDNPDNKIQIITNSEIRYRGRLYQVNPTDKTIALRDVISYGTEDRRQDRVIPPVPSVYDCIVFRSSDIKELEVVAQEEAEKEDQMMEKLQKSENQDGDMQVKTEDQLIEDQLKAQNTENQQDNAQESPEDITAKNQVETKNDSEQNDQEVENLEKQVQNLNIDDKNADNQESNQEEVKEKEEQSKPREEKPQPKPANTTYQSSNNRQTDNRGGLKPAYRVLFEAQNENFDFDWMGDKAAEFEKEKHNAQSKDDEQQAYVFDDFFDDISTSLNDRQNDPEERRNQYNLNNETFGFVKRGRGRGRGRGYNNYRGRGGYNNNYNRGGGYNNNYRNNNNYNNGGYRNNGGGYRNNNYNNGYNNGGYNNNRNYRDNNEYESRGGNYNDNYY